MHVVATWGYAGVFFWMAVGSACIPVPSEVIMPFAAAMSVTQHIYNVNTIALAGAFGNLAGSIAAYLVGMWGGRPFLQKYGRYVLIRQRDIDSADRAFARYGEAIVFFGRLVPLIRAFVSLPAGISRMNFWRFSVYTFFGGLIWCYLLTWLGVKLGQHWDLLAVYFHKADIAVGGIVVLLIAFWVWHHIRPEASAPVAAGPAESPSAMASGQDS